jgi:hypothetical protein
MDLIEAAGSGDRLSALVELRGVLAQAIATCQSMRDLPALSRQLQAVLVEIDELPREGEVCAADRIALRRAARNRW